MSTHWAFRRLSKLLSEAGFHVFRFDYFGTGDSAGESFEGNPAHWKNDICCALDELRDTSGAKDVSVVGVRLGAALAAEASAEGFRIKDLVLWDPVVIGKEYIEGLRALHRTLFPVLQEKPKDEDLNELLGYPFPPETSAAIEQINLLSLSHYTANKTFLIVSEEKTEYLQLRDQLSNTCANFEYRAVQEASEWERPEDFDQALLSNNILHAITAALTGEQKNF